MKAREGCRVVLVRALVASGVNADGRREVLGLHVTSAEDGAGWLTFFRHLIARGLTGVRLVASDAHGGLVAAIGATLYRPRIPGRAGWEYLTQHPGRGHRRVVGRRSAIGRSGLVGLWPRAVECLLVWAARVVDWIDNYPLGLVRHGGWGCGGEEKEGEAATAGVQS